VVFMCSVHRGQSDDWEFFIWLQNLVFLLVFTAEMTIKMLGMGCKTYWYSGFDAFDGFTVLVGWAFAFLDMGPVGSIFRIGRVFRIVKRAPKLHNLMSTLVSCLPSISNVFMTLMLLFFVFAVIAVELFGEVRYGVSLNVVANFGTWSAAMHALWRCALGNWRGLMYDVQVVAPDCTMTVDEFSKLPDGTEYNECGDYFTSCVFFVFFQLAATFCVLNLIVGVILHAFTWCYSLEPSQITSGLKVNAVHLLHFKEIWARFDIMETGFIDLDQLQFFMSVLQYNIPEILQVGKVNQQGEQVCKDASSFGSGVDGADCDATEAECRANYHQLVSKITRYERAADVNDRILEDGVNIHAGENTFIFNASIDNGVILADENSDEAKLIKVRYSSLIMILLMQANRLTEHDKYVCHDFRDPYKYRMPGYEDQRDDEAAILDSNLKASLNDDLTAMPASKSYLETMSSTVEGITSGSLQSPGNVHL